MDVLTEKERIEKENREIVEKLNAENVRLSTLLATAEEEHAKIEGQGKERLKFELRTS